MTLADGALEDLDSLVLSVSDRLETRLQAPDDTDGDFRAIFEQDKKEKSRPGHSGAFALKNGVVQLDSLPVVKSRTFVAGITQNSSAPKNLESAILPVEPQVRKYTAAITTPIVTTGPNWFDMKTPHITPEIKHDLSILANRMYLDPKRFYKKENNKKLPKHFQIGTVIAAPHEFFSARLTNKERAESQLDEVNKDAGTKDYLKRKYGQIQAAKSMKGSHKGRFKRKKPRSKTK